MIQGKSSGTEQSNNGANCVEIPKGWNRILDNGFVVYISPSNSQLRSLDHVIEYLKKDGTCKCGLDCPLYVHRVFNFDRRVPSRYQTQLVAEQKKTTCKLCIELSKISDQGLFQEKTSKQTKQSKRAAPKAKQLTGSQTAKGGSQSRSKAEANKPKRVNVYRPRRSSSSSLTDVPSPPIQTTISSPVQNVPTNLGASNQGPLPSFASIVSSSKFFNPGPNRGPLQPTTGLPPVSLLTGTKATTASNFIASGQSSATSSHVVQVTSTTAVKTSNAKGAAAVAVVAQPFVGNDTSVRVASQAMSTLGVAGLAASSRMSRSATIVPSSNATRYPSGETVATLISTNRPLVSSQRLVSPALVSTNPPVSFAPVKPPAIRAKAPPKPRAKPRPRAASKGGARGKKVEPQVKAGLAFQNSAFQMPASVAMPVGLQGMNVAVAPQVPSHSWPVSTVTPMTTGSSKSMAAAATVTTVVYQSPATSVVTVAAPTQNVQPQASKPQTQPVAMTTPVWVPLSHLNNQLLARPTTHTQVVASSVARHPHPQSIVTSTVSSVNATATTRISNSVTASVPASLPISATGHKLQAPPGMMYVTAKPAVFPAQFPYVTAAAQPQQVHPAGASTSTSASSVQPAVASTQVPGKVSVQMPAMYAASQVLPLNVQNFDMSQYKGTAAYQLQTGAMFPSTGMVGNTMAFITQPTKTSFAGVPTITPASQLNYPNPYMLGIVMPTTNSQQSTTSTTTSAGAPTTVMPLAMMQPQNVQNSAVAAAYENYVPIAPASGGSTPRFAQTLAHLASAYNSYTPHGMVPNLQFTYRMMQMSGYAGNPHNAALVAPAVAGVSDVSPKYPINSVKPANAVPETTKAHIQNKEKNSSQSQAASSGTTTVSNHMTAITPTTCTLSATSTENTSVSSFASTQSTAFVTSQATTCTVPNEMPRHYTQTSLTGACSEADLAQTSTMSSATVASYTTSTSLIPNKSEATDAYPVTQHHPVGHLGTGNGVAVSSRQNPTLSAPSIASTDTVNSQSVVNPVGGLEREHMLRSQSPEEDFTRTPPHDATNLQRNSPRNPQKKTFQSNIDNTPHATSGNTSIGVSNSTGAQPAPTQSSPLSDNKRTIDSSSENGPDNKRTKYEFSPTHYYEANPLLGMKRSCDAIEVYNNPSGEGECSTDDKEGYSSSNEDLADLEMVPDDRHFPDKGNGMGDVSVASNDNFKRTQELYNGGVNDNHALEPSHGPPAMNLPLKPQALPALPYRMDLFGELPPHSKSNFDIGDVVWAQARGLPSWPGQIVDESKVGKGRADDGKKWVMWFGDHTFSQVEVDKLKSLSEGLRNLDEKARKKKYRAKKTRISLEQAIDEALQELEMRDRLNARQGMSHAYRAMFP